MRYAYYPGCSLSSTGLEYGISTKAVAKHLGIDLWEIPDWNCCGSSPAHNKDHWLSLALPARNMAIVEQEDENLDIVVPCASCYGRLKATQQAVKNSEETRKTVEDIIEMKYEGKNEVKSLLDVVVNDLGLEKIKEKVVKPLSNLKVASYYGCLLVRPVDLGFDDPEDPQTMDSLVGTLGGNPIDWAFKVECCGATISTSRPNVGISMINGILQDAKDKGAECIITACPLCFLNLDMHQNDSKTRSGENFNLPIFYFTELIGLALGYSPKEIGLGKHFINPLPLLEKKDILRHPGARREEVI